MKTHQKINYFLCAAVIYVLPCQVSAWPWGPQNFDECVLEEMKGRTKDQRSLVYKVCSRKFPALENYLDTDYQGTLICDTKRISHDPIKVTIDSKYVKIIGIDVEITDRTTNEVHAEHFKDKANGLKFFLDFMTGVATVYLYDDGAELFDYFPCHE